jgi:hypothetical protein
MKRITSLALAAFALAGCKADLDSPVGADAGHALTPSAPLHALAAAGAASIAGQYIVQLNANVVADTSAVASLVASANGQLMHMYSQALFNGFAAKLSASEAATLASHPAVQSIVPDEIVTASAGGVQTSAPWGLDRLDQASLPLSTSYGYAGDGAGVTVYIVDTGINFGHTDFGGRAVPGYDAITPGGTAVDCKGHGTHVSGTVGGSTFGVAKGVSLVGVRVLDCSGNGSTSTALAGMNWVLAQKQANPTRPMIVNMSLGGGVSTALDNGVASLTAAGVTVVVAAGNSAADACNQSPAREPSAITVGATDKTDSFASFSNFGSCVDIDAPGVGILSDYIGSATATATLSGTSMASPHVAGVAALYLAAHPSATPAQVAAALTGNARIAPIAKLPASTTSRLLNVSFLGATAVNQAPTAVIATPLANASYTQGAAVSMTGTGADLEDGVLAGTSLAWSSNLGGALGTGISLTTTALAVGTHTITLKATDSQGAVAIATRTITITAPVNQAPTASITTPGAGATFVQGASVTFAGTGNDVEDGALSAGSLVWTSSLDGALGTGASLSKATLSVGTHSITLTAKDSKGATGIATRSITITAPVNQAPTAAITAPGAGSSFVQGTVIAFSGTGTDPEDGALGGASLVWTSSIDGTVGTGASLSKSTLSAGTHAITLTATDSKGAASTATLSITVTVPPPATPTGTVVSATGWGCLTIAPSASAYTWLKSCAAPTAKQVWTTPATGVVGMITSAGGGCLAAAGAGNPGYVVGASPCDPTSKVQQWTFTSAGEIKLMNGNCAAVERVSWGDRLVMAACNGTPAQSFTR